jgi:hypothetical protein
MDFSPKDKQRKERNSISTGIKIENLFPRTTVECVTYLIIYQIIVGQPAKGRGFPMIAEQIFCSN